MYDGTLRRTVRQGAQKRKHKQHEILQKKTERGRNPRIEQNPRAQARTKAAARREHLQACAPQGERGGGAMSAILFGIGATITVAHLALGVAILIAMLLDDRLL